MSGRAEAADRRFERVAIIGVGLIGGSFALALKQQRLAGHITGCGRNAEHLARGVALGVIDDYSTSVQEAVRGADLVLLAMPVGASQAVFEAMAGQLAPETIITDAGSTKASVIRAAQAAFGAVPPRFVPGHPVAGTEQSGVEAAFPTLFEGRRVILTPLEQTDMQAVSAVRALWQAVGADVVDMDADHHDEVLAATSHLPHLLAYSLVDTLARMAERREVFEYAAGGFADFSRIASSSPDMWVDIAEGNRDALLSVLDDYLGGLNRLRADIDNGRWAEVRQLFARAKLARDGFVERVGRQADH
ncbi:MAG: prephenate dehydrogenase [Salinisphaeraceae bacterium]|nr:prephenate dehydrogenase [Salinisphaeraceae bacterium]